MTNIISTNGFLPNGDRDALAFISFLHGGALATDRFGLLNRHSRWRMDGAFRPMPQPEGEGTAREFSDILDAEVQKVLARGLDVCVSWSGGLDSSCLLCGFLRSGMDLRRLRVLYSAESAAEFPALFRLLQRGGIRFVEAESSNIFSKYREMLEGSTLCMGWHGDQLYGRLLLQRFPQAASLPWQDACAQMGAALGWGGASEAVAQLEAAFAEYGAPVESGAQFAWWQSFAACWHMRAGSEGVLGLGFDGRVADVFGAEAFQRWSVSRAARGELLADLSPAACKPEMKAVILDVAGDAEWTASHIKGSGGRSVWPREDGREPELVVFTAGGEGAEDGVTGAGTGASCPADAETAGTGAGTGNAGDGVGEGNAGASGGNAGSGAGNSGAGAPAAQGVRVLRFRYPVPLHPSRRAAAFRRLCEDILPQWRRNDE